MDVVAYRDVGGHWYCTITNTVGGYRTSAAWICVPPVTLSWLKDDP
jgi:hypothetical protein